MPFRLCYPMQNSIRRTSIDPNQNQYENSDVINAFLFHFMQFYFFFRNFSKIIVHFNMQISNEFVGNAKAYNAYSVNC